ncbi:MAG: Na+/H+ antiporter subunit E [Chitinispirillaceae bacterium]|nr:Na+/H+ antiporter subunit E [Chitinispirillaceae bacterium]
MFLSSKIAWNILRIIFTFIFLLFLWFLFSSSLNIYNIIVGIIGAIVISLFSYRLFIEDWEAGRRSIIPRFLPLLVYFCLMIFWLYKASFIMAIAIIKGTSKPNIVSFKSKIRSDLARVILAHSITFTPGSITLELDEDHYIVHWMFTITHHSTMAGDLIKGKMEKQLRKIWI